MFALYWPIGLLVLSNVFYHIAAKEIPTGTDPFMCMVVTYVVGAIVSFILFLTVGEAGDPIKEVGTMNWAPYILGIAIVGLEVGAIFMYKVGWEVSTGNVVQAIFVAIGLLIVGILIFNEQLTVNKAVGIAACMVGIYFLNK